MQLDDMQPPAQRIVIVDPQLGEYADHYATGDQPMTITCTNRGIAALRLVPSHSDAHWIVNSELPDMTGLELLEMLYAIHPDLSVQVVTERYDVEEELQAFRLGVEGYSAKSVQT